LKYGATINLTQLFA